jgi:tetratricopeptide (TPR) repeat protein
MKALARTSIAGLIAGVLMIGSLAAQDLSEITAATRELRQTLRDLDKRMTRLEKLLNREAAERKKNPRANPPAKETPIRMDPAAQLIAGQDAYRRGRIEEAAEKYDKAIEFYTEAVRFDPGNDLAFLRRGMASLHAGRVDQALADANQSLSIQPNSAQAYAFRGSVYLSIKAPEKASADFKEASLRDLENPDYVIRQAEAQQALGNLKAVIELYDAAAKLRPQSGEILIRNAGVLRQANEASRAVELCGRAIALMPNEAEGYACRAESLLKMGALPNAISDLNRAFSLQPALPEVAKLLPVVKDMIQVNESFAQMTAWNAKRAPEVVVPAPRAVESVVEHVVEHVVERVVEPVPPVKIAAPEPAHTEAPKPAAPASTTSTEALRDGRKSLGREIELNPSSAVAYNSRGYAYLRTHQFELAIRDFSKAISINSEYANAYWNRSAARRLAGDVPGSRQDIQLAAKLGYPTSPPGR